MLPSSRTAGTATSSPESCDPRIRPQRDSSFSEKTFLGGTVRSSCRLAKHASYVRGEPWITIS